MGVISALGCGIETTADRLVRSESGVGRMRYLNTVHTEIPVAEVPFSDADLREMLAIAPGFSITRTSLLGRVALREAVEMARLKGNDDQRVAFLSGTTVGGMEKSEQFYKDFLTNDLRNEYIALHDCGACTDMIAQEFPGRITMQTTISTACSSAANAIIFGADLLRCGRTDLVIAGGTECLSKFHLDGFNTLMILDSEPCKPCDKYRPGLNLGEGAAYVVMETRENAAHRGVQPICQLSGYANQCDAYHQTASSPEGEGAFLAMSKALQSANLKPTDIDYINAHGTGTPNNDESEGKAMMRVFGDKVPLVSSTKAYTGHPTSAAGGIESVISILALTRNFVPANLNFSEKIDTLNFTPVTETITNIKLQHVLCNSFGFGGNDSSCIFSKIN